MLPGFLRRAQWLLDWHSHPGEVAVLLGDRHAGWLLRWLRFLALGQHNNSGVSAYEDGHIPDFRMASEPGLQ